MTDETEKLQETIRKLEEENEELREYKKMAEELIENLRNSLGNFEDKVQQSPKKRRTEERLLLQLCRENRIFGKALIKKRGQLETAKQEVEELQLTANQPSKQAFE
jgi:predicted RNase H-like nuclease (RuvC/YqgF family)